MKTNNFNDSVVDGNKVYYSQRPQKVSTNKGNHISFVTSRQPGSLTSLIVDVVTCQCGHTVVTWSTGYRLYVCIVNGVRVRNDDTHSTDGWKQSTTLHFQNEMYCGSFSFITMGKIRSTFRGLVSVRLFRRNPRIIPQQHNIHTNKLPGGCRRQT